MKALAWLVVAAAAAAPLAAQEHPMGAMGGGMMRGNMMAGMDSMMAPMMEPWPTPRSICWSRRTACI